MNYDDLIVKALRGRKVTEAARDWGVRQPTLYKWFNGQGLPNFSTVKKLAEDAELSTETVVDILAATEQIRESKQFKLQKGFVQIEMLALLATGGLYGVFLYYVKRLK
ncbi:MAG: helix-turn-helix transcriptional regulator [Massilia sp.]